VSRGVESSHNTEEALEYGRGEQKGLVPFRCLDLKGLH